MSKIIQLGEHKWRLPDPPSSATEVLYSKHKKSDQYWRRDNNFPKIFYDYNPYTIENADATRYDDHTGELISLSVEDTAKILLLREREMTRRFEGVWFMNYGELTYLTGSHYFQLQWGAMKDYTNPYDGGKYGEYREFQAHTQYFLEMNKLDPNVAGSLIVKPKKTGITQMVALNFVDISTRYKEKNLGIMSKSTDDVKDANFDYYQYGFDELPFIFRPEVASRTTMAIEFAKPRVKVSGTRANIRRQLDNSKGFNTTVFCRGLVANAFDGPVMFYYWNDEWTKFEDPYPGEVYKKTSEVVKKQEVIVGNGIWTAYVAETDDRSFREAKQLWNDSKMSTLSTITSRTKSEFKAYCITADVSGESGFDRYGKPDIKRNETYIKAKREQLKNDRAALQAYTRQYPLTEEEAWREGGGGGSPFDNIRLGKQKQIVEDRLNATDLPYVQGKLEWIDSTLPVWQRKVVFMPTTEEEIMRGEEGYCRFYGYDQLDHNRFNYSVINKILDEKGYLKPADDSPYCGAVDPVEYILKKHVAAGSKYAITAMNFPDTVANSKAGKLVTNRFVFTYLHRHEDPDDNLDDTFKMMLFLGCHVLVENNKAWVTTRIIKEKLHNFLLVRDAKSRAIVPYDEHKHQTLISTTNAGNTSVVDDYCRAFATHIRAPLTEHEPDNLPNIQDERLLTQAMAFDPLDTKPYDLFVCSAYNVMAVQSFGAVRQALASKPKRYSEEELALAFEILM